MKIYFDMDGVLADFESGTCSFCGLERLAPGQKRTPEEDDFMWSKIREVPHFYDVIAPLPDGVELFNLIYSIYGDKCEILTGIPRPKRGIPTAAEDKIRWAHRVLNPDVKVNAVYRSDKPKFCNGPDCYLIDDLESNIEGWENMGGTGILYDYPDGTYARELLKKIGII